MFFPATNRSVSYAIATAPVPLPLFGAAAGFGWRGALRGCITYVLMLTWTEIASGDIDNDNLLLQMWDAHAH
jgi:hypothetical protein